MRVPAIIAVILVIGTAAFLCGCGDDSTGPGNRAPGTGLEADPEVVDPTGTSDITSTATDPDGDVLSYTWSADAGTISGTGATVTWTAPLAAGSYDVSVTVDDGNGHTVSDTIEIEVRAGTLLLQSWTGLTAIGMDGSSFVLHDSFTLVEVLGTRIFINASPGSKSTNGRARTQGLPPSCSPRGATPGGAMQVTTANRPGVGPLGDLGDSIPGGARRTQSLDFRW